MIICNGVVGLCMLVGGLAHREQSFRVEGAGAGAGRADRDGRRSSLVLPDFTTSTALGTYSNAQLAFVAVTSAVLWAVFVFIQTVRHRDYFLPGATPADPDVHARRRRIARRGRASACCSSRSCRVVGLAKVLSPSIERRVDRGRCAEGRDRHR